MTFDSTSGTKGTATPRIFVGVASLGSTNVLVSEDSGATCACAVVFRQILPNSNVHQGTPFQDKTRHICLTRVSFLQLRNLFIFPIPMELVRTMELSVSKLTIVLSRWLNVRDRIGLQVQYLLEHLDRHHTGDRF